MASRNSPLPALALLGLALFVPAFMGRRLVLDNGLYALVERVWSEAAFPDARLTPLRTVYVGWAPLDGLLARLVVFFWPIASAASPALVVHSVAFSGLFTAAWILVSLETWRAGNARTASGYSVHLGIAAQTLSLAFATPVYALVHLLTSTTASLPTGPEMRLPPAVLSAIPAVYLLLSVLPGLAMVAPPMTLSVATAPAVHLRQTVTALWQPWPVFVAVALVAAHHLLPQACSPARSPASYAFRLRLVYAVAFASAAAGHIVAATITGAAAVVPHIFRADLAPQLHPARVLATVLPGRYAAEKLAFSEAGLADGIHNFLRWDYNVTSVALLVWTATLYARAYRFHEGRSVCSAALLAKVLSIVLVAGPGAAAVELMWERDEFVLQSTRGDNGKRVTSSSSKTKK